MDNTTTPETAESPAPFLDEILLKSQAMVEQYWAENPDLYEIVQQNKRGKEAALKAAEIKKPKPSLNAKIEAPEIQPPPPLMGALKGAPLRAKIRESHLEIHRLTKDWRADIDPLTAASNGKCACELLASKETSFQY